MLHAFDAKLPPAAGRNGQARLGKLHERRVVHALLGKVFGKTRTDPGLGAVALHFSFQNAEAVFANRIVQRKRRVVARLQRLGKPQRLHRVAPPVHAFQRLTQHDQCRMAQGRGLCPQIGIGRPCDGPVAVGPLELPVRPARLQKKARIIDPALGRIGQVQRRADKAASPFEIAIRFGLGGRLQQLVHRPAAGDMLVAKTVGLQTRLIDVVIGQEVQLGPPKTRIGQNRRIRQGDQPGIGPGEWNGLSGTCLGETGPVARVEGEGGAAAVGQTGALTGLKGGVEDRRQVATWQIDVLAEDKAALRHRGLLGGSGAADQRKGCQKRSRNQGPGQGTHQSYSHCRMTQMLARRATRIKPKHRKTWLR